MIALGTPHHGSIFVGNMNANLKHYGFSFLEPHQQYGWCHLHPEQLDVLWVYGFHGLPNQVISSFKEVNPNLKVVVTWVGSDVLELMQFAKYRPRCVSCILKDVNVHVADGQNLVGEMKQFFDVSAVYIPSIPEKPFEFKPLPEQFSVAGYVPGFRADFFNFRMIQDVAEKMPDVEFNLFGGRPQKLELDVLRCPNLFDRGWVVGEEKRKWWEQSSVVLYMPQHGSIGVIALEFLQMGRYAILSMDAPHCFKATTIDDLLVALKKLQEVKEANIEGSKYYSEMYSPKRQALLVRELLDKLR